MKIFDCTTFYSEHLMMDVRFNVLNEHVHKFIVAESTFSHSGEPKKLNFDINNYPKFKDKIIYVIIDKEPNNIIGIEDKLLTAVDKRSNSLKRIELSYDYMIKSLDMALDNDLIILSDNDEIPNLGSKQFKSSNKDIFIFKQLFFYYKFNLFYDLVPWYGSKAAKKKKLLSMSWLRNLKNKQYPFWRLDTLFSNNKYINLDIVNDGGWHFTNLKTAEELYQKPATIFESIQKFLGLPKFHPANYAHYNLGKRHEISTTTRNFLREFFKPYNEELYKFLGRDFGWER